jgi:hypothetical protein
MDDKEARYLMQRIQTQLSPAQQDHLVEKSSQQARGELVALYQRNHKTNKITGRTNTGATAQAWNVKNAGQGSRQLVNVPSVGGKNVAAWLEDGTKAHGGKGGKPLFIPLTPEAQANTSKKGGKKLIFGEDYILAKRVKGIKAYKHVEKFMPRATKIIYTNALEAINRVI